MSVQCIFFPLIDLALSWLELILPAFKTVPIYTYTYTYPGANYVFLSLNMCENAFTQILLLVSFFFLCFIISEGALPSVLTQTIQVTGEVLGSSETWDPSLIIDIYYIILYH